MNKQLIPIIALFLGLSITSQAEQTANIQVKVTVSNELPNGRFTKNWPVHIYLSSPGSKIPLSSTTSRLGQLPLTTVLTEKDYVLPSFTLEGHKELILVTKVSSSGDPHNTGPEDYRQTSAPFMLDPNNQAQVKMILK